MRDNPCFHGHFSGFPLTPGVVQLAWVIYFANLHLDIGQPKPPQPIVKFQLPIFPDDSFQLHLDWQADPQRLNYRLSTLAGDAHASGRLQY
jgi:3-hydroxymyristoyl/3-hydroxydecanoyl-(acyl carrier protein) dehydratase